MPEQVGQAVYELLLDTRRFEAGTKGAESRIKGLDGALGGMARTAASVALGMGGLSLSITASKAAISGTINAARDLNESMNKTRVVFKDNSGEIERWSKSSAEGFGLSRRSALEAASTFGNLFSAMKIGIPESARLSTKIVELAADLASFNNLNIDDVLLALRSGLVGEVEPLRRLGIAINEATVKAKAMELGLASSKGELSESAKIQARYALILEQSGNAQGDFARTSDDLANAQRILSAQMANAGASLGQLLIPAITAGTVGLAALATQAQHVDKLGDVFRSVALAVGVLGAAFAAMKIGTLTAAVLGNVAAFTSLARQFGIVSAASIFLSPATAGVIGFGAAIVIADLATRKLTGSGLIDWITGVAQAHRRAAAAAKSQGVAEEELALLRREGVADVDARRLEINKQITNALKTQSDLAAARVKAEAIVTGPARGRSNIGAALAPAQSRADAETKQQIENIRKLELNYAELSAVIAAAPSLGPGLANDLKAAAAAAGSAAVAATDFATAIKKVRDEQDAFSTSVDTLTTIFDGLDSGTEALRVQQRELELLKTRMGDAFGDANQAKLDEVSRLLELATGNVDLFKDRLTLTAAIIAEQFGPDVAGATTRTNELVAALMNLPEDQRIKIAVLLPDLARIEGAFKAFIEALQRGATVTVAIRAAAVAAAPSGSIADRFGGQRWRRAPRALTSEQQGLIDEWTGTMDDAAARTAGSLGAVAGGADKASSGLTRLEQVMAAVADGTIDLSEAIALGLSDQEVVTLELAKAQGDAEAAAFRHRIGLLALARAYPGLNGEQIRFAMGLAAIQAHLAATGETIAQFLRKVNTGILDTARSAIDTLLGGPTRESLQLDLRRKELERRKLLIQQGGAETDDPRIKRIDSEIDALSRVIELRQNEIDQLRIKAQLADETIRTDRDLINAYTWLFGVVSNFSSALQDATTFLHDFSGMGAAPEASFAGGISNVPRPMRAMLHTGERVLTASENRQLSAGTPAVTFSQQFTVNADMGDAAMNRLADIVERANTRSLNRWRGSVLGGRGTN